MQISVSHQYRYVKLGDCIAAAKPLQGGVAAKLLLRELLEGDDRIASVIIFRFWQQCSKTMTTYLYRIFHCDGIKIHGFFFLLWPQAFYILLESHVNLCLAFFGEILDHLLNQADPHSEEYTFRSSPIWCEHWFRFSDALS